MHTTDSTHQPVPSFLARGGEMGELIRNYDWATTSLGPVENWPQSLRTTLGIVLHSAFPMFLFWGRELICFYNDAFLPSLGVNGKHPAIGKKATDVWPEIWDFVGPLIEGVMTTAQPVWFEDQLVPFFRNGKVEDIYWTFSYSPTYGDDGEISGVFVTCTETTKQVVAAKRSRENATQILSYVESAPFPIGVYEGLEMRITFANKAIIDVWGKGPNVVGKLYTDILPELASQHIFDQLRQVYTTGIAFHNQNQYLELVVDGELRPFYFNYSFTPLFDASGAVYGVMNTAADVTELNTTKQQIQQSEANLRNMILQAPVAMCILRGPQHVIEIANSMMIELWGKPADTVISKPVFEALPDAREQGLEALLDSVYNNGEPYTASEMPVELVRHGNKELVYQSFVYVPYRDTGGKVIGVLVISLDVTQQVIARQEIEEVVKRRTEELQRINSELMKSEERYHRMVDEVEDYAIILLDKDGIVQHWNKGAQKIKGYKDEEIIGKSFEIFYQEEDRQKGLPYKLINEARVKGKATTEGWRVKKGGNRFWGSILITALHDTSGEVIGFSKVTRDLTERKMAEDKLREYSANLEFQNRELEQFAYAASHDMKEPLRKIHFYSTYLNDNLQELDGKSRNYLGRILSSAKKMSNLVENILSYSRASSNADALQPVNLDEVVRDVITSALDDYEDSSISIQAQPLPVIIGIPFQWTQLVDNLVHNAIKYQHPDRKCKVSIEHNVVPGDSIADLGALPGSDYHRISVTDNGTGFDPRYSEKIFEIFQRLDTTGKAGAGIGLAICKRIVLNHRGIIKATGIPGQGARFDIYIPVGD